MLSFIIFQIVVDRCLPFISAILQKCENTAADLTEKHIQVLEKIVGRFICNITEQTLDVLVHCLQVEYTVEGTNGPHVIALNQVQL